MENRSLNGVQLATTRHWEPDTHVHVKSITGNLHNLNARTRVVYCRAVGAKRFFVGLNILSRDGEQTTLTDAL